MLSKFKTLCAGLIMAVTVVACGGGSTPEETAKNYIEAVVASDLEAVVATVNIPDESKREDIKGKLGMLIASFQDKIQKNEGFDKYEIKDVVIKDNEATLTVISTFKNGETNSDDLRLIKVDGKWLINLKRKSSGLFGTRNSAPMEPPAPVEDPQ